MTIKTIVHNNEMFLSRIYRFFGHNHTIRNGKGNVIKVSTAFIRQCFFNINGSSNTIIIEGDLTRLKKCRINISGSNNTIIIGHHVVMERCVLSVENDCNIIQVGDNTWMNPNVELAAIEGTSIIIGKNCMFSSNIVFRTGDSHSVVDYNSGLRVNKSLDIFIGNHVWIGNDVKVLKGGRISNDSVVSTGAIVTNHSYEPYSVLAGIPAKVVKTGITWDKSRNIPFK